MRRYLVVMFLVSSLHAGMYVGAGIDTKIITGSYYEEETFTNNSWEIDQQLQSVKFNAGYGFADALSIEANLMLLFYGYEVGANLQYGFDIGNRFFYPHILVGGAYADLSNSDISVKTDNNSNPVYTLSGPEMLSFKLGVGASFVMTDTIEIYGDIMMLWQEETQSDYQEHGASNNFGVGAVTSYTEYDTSMIEIQVGVRFYMSGATSKRYNFRVDTEKRREQEIDDYIN